MSYTIVLRPQGGEGDRPRCRMVPGSQPAPSRAFLNAIDGVLDRITQNPDQFPVLKHEPQRAVVTGFPYSVLFRIVGTELVVTTCVHFRRHPRQWRAD